MPQITYVKKCRKPCRCSKCGDKIKKGVPYRWWKFNFGARFNRCMKTECAPMPSDLTRSAYQGAIADIQKEGFGSCDSFADLTSRRDELVEQINGIADECEEKHNNMPPSLQEGDTGVLLQERAETCRNVVSELEGVDIPDEEPGEEKGEEKDDSDDDAIGTVKEELEQALGNLS